MAIARVIVECRAPRRRMMIGALLIAAAQCFVGSVVLKGGISEHPVFLLMFWGACLLFVLIAIGLALLDMLKLRQELSQSLRDLKRTVNADEEES